MGLGASILRLQDDDASYADVRDVLVELISSPDFRERCVTTALLVKDFEVDRRQEMCRHMATLLLNDHKPPDGVPKYGRLKQTTAHFAKYCAPPPYSRWRHHVDVIYDKGGGVRTAGSARVSTELYTLLDALETLWGVQGHLLKR